MTKKGHLVAQRTREAGCASVSAQSKNFSLPQQTQTATQAAAQTGRRGADPYGIAKAIAESKPILGVRYMRPRWRTLAETKIPAVHRQNGGRQGGPGGKVRASFLATSWDAPRSGIQNRHSARAKLGARPSAHKTKTFPLPLSLIIPEDFPRHIEKIPSLLYNNGGQKPTTPL